jgi:ABC-type lipoprotein export system ATPase subunit
VYASINKKYGMVDGCLMMKELITILSGYDKQGNAEKYNNIVLFEGDMISIVGSTGSGKSSLISDIELLVQRDSISKRKILLNGREPTYSERFDPTVKMISMITQNTKCVTDLPVSTFLEIHARARNITDNKIIDNVVELANRFTGEPIGLSNNVTDLSGGQTKSILVADALLIGCSPIILLDEIENAGIDRSGIIQCIKQYNKLIIFVTHDPYIIFKTNKWIIMKNGAINKIFENEQNTELIKEIEKYDKKIEKLRWFIRNGVDMDYNSFSFEDI